jgi:hypothetical protein
MLTVCGGLIAIDPASRAINFADPATRRYFERTGSSWFPNAENQLAEACFAYISLDQSDIAEKELTAYMDLNPNRFFRYAVLHLDRHFETIRLADPNMSFAVIKFGGGDEAYVKAKKIVDELDVQKPKVEIFFE